MTHRILLLMLASLTTAQAASIPIKTLITGSGGQLTLEQGLFLVRKRTSDLTSLDLGIGIRQQRAGRIQSVGVFALKEYLKPSELALLVSNTSRIATQCFNISQKRMNALAVWLTRQNSQALRNVESSFGPMKVTFVRDVNDDGTYYTAVDLARSGVPGLAPWVNYCTV